MFGKSIFFSDKITTSYFAVLFIAAYVLPIFNLQEIDTIRLYVDWFISIFKTFDFISSRSADYFAYKLFFSLGPVFIPIFAILYYFKPITFDYAKIYRHKIFYFIGFTFLSPLFIVGVIFSLTQDMSSSNIFATSVINNLSAKSRFYLILLMGSLFIAISFLIAMTVAWYVNIAKNIFH